ncbi:MAG: 16S rRNA (guanine(527)-N(7))-methyltransferase RsmG [Candidatus Latescibacteria bacterium]|nr:16S rRNA (guanine(527)-N(7))-methyltransferase RsmG [Candidatus Latescibacterota bacterium]
MPRRRKRNRPEPPRERWDRELEELKLRLRSYRLDLDQTRKERLRLYLSHVYEWSRRIALLSRGDVEHLVWKHIGSSLGPLLVLSPTPGSKWVDIGSGAGLPGLVLKIWEPSQELHLVESSRKKCIFLEEARRRLGVGEIPIHTLRVETWLERGERIGEFDLLMTRAVANVTNTLRDFGRLVRPGGKVLTFKGPGWLEDLNAAKERGLIGRGRYRLEQVVRIPWAPGHLLLLRKDGE